MINQIAINALADLMIAGIDAHLAPAEYTDLDIAEMLIEDADEWDDDLMPDESLELLDAIKIGHGDDLDTLINSLTTKINNIRSK